MNTLAFVFACLALAPASAARAEEEPDCGRLYNPDAQWLIDRSKDLEQRFPGDAFAADRKAYSEMFGPEGEKCRFMAAGFFFKLDACKAACLKYKELQAKAGVGEPGLAQRCKTMPEDQLMKDAPLYRSCMDLFIKDKKVTEADCWRPAANPDPRMTLVCARLAAQKGDVQGEAAAIADYERKRALQAQRSHGLHQQGDRAVGAARRDAVEIRPLQAAPPPEAAPIPGPAGPDPLMRLPRGEAVVAEHALGKISDPAMAQTMRAAFSNSPALAAHFSKAADACDAKPDPASCQKGLEARYRNMLSGRYTNDEEGQGDRAYFAYACGKAAERAKGAGAEAADLELLRACAGAGTRRRRAPEPPAPSGPVRLNASRPAAPRPSGGCEPPKVFLIRGTHDLCVDVDVSACECRVP